MRRTWPMTRRDALRLGAAGVVAGCSDKGAINDTGFSEELAPAPWEPEGAVDDSAFPLGVQVGDPRSDSANCWTRYDGDADATLVVAQWNGQGWVEWSRSVWTPAGGGFIHAAVEGLSGGTWYAFFFEGSTGRSITGRWRSPDSAGLRTLVFGGSACTWNGHAPFPVLSQAAQADLDFFLLAGDQVYADSSQNVAEYRAHWAANLGTAGYRDLLASTAAIATWDDHEVRNEWGTNPVSAEQEANGKQAFFENTACTPRLGDPLWRSLRFGDTLELYVLDCRSERDPATGQYISEEQFEWLVESMRSSNAVFQCILNSVPMVDLEELVGDFKVEDRWQGFPEQRARLIEAIGSVDNTYFLTGDFHTGLVARVDAEGPGHGMFDVLMGAAGNNMNPMGGLLVPTDQFLTGVSDRNYARFTAEPATEKMVVEYVGEDGSVMDAISLPDGEKV